MISKINPIIKFFILGLIGSFASWIILWFVMAGSVYLFVPQQPEPIIRYKEFTIQLVYEVEGKEYIIADSIICEYDGQEFNEGTGEKYRKWKSRLKSGNTRITLFNTMDGIEIFYLDLRSFPAGAYMGEPTINADVRELFPDALYTKNFEDRTIGRYIISSNEMWEKYKLRLINWEIAPPIKNKFE